MPASRGARAGGEAPWRSAVAAKQPDAEPGCAPGGGEEFGQVRVPGAKRLGPHEVPEQAEVGASLGGAEQGFVFAPQGIVPPVVADLDPAPMIPGVPRQRPDAGLCGIVAAKIKPALGGDLAGALFLALGIDHEHLAHMGETELVGVDGKDAMLPALDPAVGAVYLGKKGVGLSLASSAATIC
jgi:hypothetical protein